MTRKLSGEANWQYVLREFDYTYRRGSAGGSAPISAHMDEVRKQLAQAMASDPKVRSQRPRSKPVADHLDRALHNGVDGWMKHMLLAIGQVKDRLTWSYGYARMPQRLKSKYAFAELLGPNGPVVWPDLALGLVLFAPATTYPSHSHAGITESYLSLSGFWSENDSGVYAPGSLVLNMPGQTHRITSQTPEPVLLAYAWTGARETLAEPPMQFEDGAGGEAEAA